MTRPTILVLAPMPVFPTSAGNRRRLLATCRSLQRGGFSVDLAYFAHEDQIYRRFGQHPPTDMAATELAFQRTFLIEAQETIPLKTRSHCFGIDDWCPDEVGDFVAWYFASHPATRAILVNYVFLSRVLARVPSGVLTMIDTHDRFADRRSQYRPFRAEPNFFYTDAPNEKVGLDRADLVLAIQSEEAAAFRALTTSQVHLLPPRFPVKVGFRAPTRLERIGFIGHGNDPNLVSIGKFAHAWTAGWTPDQPELVIAGEICNSLGGLSLPGVRLSGYVARIEDFYDGVDLVVAPMLMGSGLKMKVAEALSFGVPVVGTAIGFEGFDPIVPAHRARGVDEVKAVVLALSRDEAGLAALTRACRDLFGAYDVRSETAETDLIAMIHGRLGGHESDIAPEPAPSGRSPASEPEATVSHAFGSVVLTRETSSRSAERDDPDHGRLVATERSPAGAAAAQHGYVARRRRWFAKAADVPVARTGAALLASRTGRHALALSPEWVRDRTLPARAREDLALLLSEVEPDWRAQAKLIGAADGLLLMATVAPSLFVSGPRRTAVFLLDRAGLSASERTNAAFRAALAGWGASFTARRDDLTPVPTMVSLEHDLAQPLPTSQVVVLTDDLIGVLDLVDANRPGSPS